MRNTFFILLSLVLVECGGDEDRVYQPPNEAVSGPADHPGAAPPLAGFGRECAPYANPCPDQLVCLKSMGSALGYCTRTCVQPGSVCPGAPEGTRATCTFELRGSGLHLCSFGCGKGYTCPPDLECQATPLDAEGLRRCELP
jgi:hypothetical protein